MKDVNSTSFGLVIAFVLPGFAAFYSLSFWSHSIDNLFRTFLTTEANVGLFLLVSAAAVIISLQITLVRWLIFEKGICRKYKVDGSSFEQLGTTGERLSAFTVIVDAHYRYHQFWGGMVVVLPVFGVGWLRQEWIGLSRWEGVAAIVALLSAELLTGWAAACAYELYAIRAQRILCKGG